MELTLALHRVFSSPDDAIVWDTGHQAYVHKLVTGREQAFAGLRQSGGLSGYPNRSESAHDLVENSHASTALSYAYGLAEARQLRGDRRRVVAVVGDGALDGRCRLRGAQQHRHLRSRRRRRAQRQRPLLRPDGVADLLGRPPSRLRPGQTALPRREFFEALGLGYLGPVDGHDLEPLEAALRQRLERRRARWCSTCTRSRAAATSRPSATRRSASTTSAPSTRRPVSPSLERRAG